MPSGPACRSGRRETRQTLPGARPSRRVQPRFAGGRGALPNPRVGRMSRRATGGLDGWPSPPTARSTGQNTAYRPPRWRTLGRSPFLAHPFCGAPLWLPMPVAWTLHMYPGRIALAAACPGRRCTSMERDGRRPRIVDGLVSRAWTRPFRSGRPCTEHLHGQAARVADAATYEGQSSSGRKMCGAVQELQIGVAVSRSPSGIGRRRSGNRHSTS
jgi:hypothetical protein